MAEIRKAALTDVPDILPLVEQYWRFEGISGFDRDQAGTRLKRVLSEPRLGAG